VKVLLEKFKASKDRNGIFKAAVENESLYGISNYKDVIALNFALIN
jgi:hypothetical protein